MIDDCNGKTMAASRFALHENSLGAAAVGRAEAWSTGA